MHSKYYFLYLNHFITNFNLSVKSELIFVSHLNFKVRKIILLASKTTFLLFISCI